MEYLSKYKFKATSEPYQMQDCDVVFCIVNTPSDPIAFSNKQILNSIDKVKPYLKKCKLFVIVSTIMPNSHQDIQKKLQIPICYNPEFIALGNVIEGIEKPDFILIGEENKQVGNLLESIYKKISKSPIKRMSITEAEITKIALNSFITMKITFANLIGEISEKCKCDGDIVCNALGEDKRIGKRYLKPGAMYSGPCFPRDNRAFDYFLKRNGMPLNYCQLTDKINNHQLDRTLKRIKAKIGNVIGQKISLLGMNYKIDSEETTESMGLKLNHLLKEKGAETEIDVISEDTDLVIFCMPDKRVETDKEVLDLWES
jgi:UDPglucose 6-dehydrogenase